jgi:hypothetical protein
MKIFGINFTTKKELREQVADLMGDVEYLTEELNYLGNTFPFDLGDVVYDVALKDDKGRYTKTDPSLEHSTITEVTVDEKNYFSLVKRLERNDVFFAHSAAEEYLKSICK